MTIIKWLRDENARLKDVIKKHEIRISEMVGAIAKMKRRLDYYENPHSPPSQSSIPARQRKAAAREAVIRSLESPASGRQRLGMKL